MVVVWGGVAGAVMYGVSKSSRVALLVGTVMLSPRNTVGRWAFRSLVALTGLIWITQPWSSPPPSSHAVAGVALAILIFPLLGAWIDRHRSTD